MSERQLVFGVILKADASDLVAGAAQGEAATDSLKGSISAASAEMREMAASARIASAGQSEAIRSSSQLAQINLGLRAAYGQATIGAREHGAAEQALGVSITALGGDIRDLIAAIGALGTAQDSGAGKARRFNQALKEGEVSIGQRRAGMQQLSYQIGDVSQQLALGVNPAIVFGQQIGQVTQAAQLMTGATKGFIGFMAGPWGAVLTGAITVAGMLAAEMFNNADAAQAAKAGSDGLSEAQSVLGKMFDLTSGKIKNQNDLLFLNARLTEITLRAEAMNARNSANAIIGRDSGASFLGGTGAFFSRAGGGTSPFERVGALEARGDQQYDLLNAIRTAPNEKARTAARDRALQESERMMFEGTTRTKVEFQQAIIDMATAEAKDAVANELKKTLDSGVLSDVFKNDSKRKPKSGDALARFGDSAEEKIARIGERFDQTPSVIDQAAQATRELDGLIADLEKRKPPNFAAMIESAKAAKVTVADGLGRQLSDQIDRINSGFDQTPKLIDRAADATADLDKIIKALGEKKPVGWEALVQQAERAKVIIQDGINRPLTDMLDRSREQLQVQSLALQGREAEAEALSRIHALEERMGPLRADQKEQVLATVIAEEAINKALEDRSRRLSAYYSATQDVRSALEKLLSGGSGGDFLKDLQNTFKQLQGRALTEKLFGPALRELDDFVSGRSGVQASIDVLTKQADRAGDATGEMADRVNDAVDILQDVIRKISDPDFVTGGRPALSAPAVTQPDDPDADIVVVGDRSRGGVPATEVDQQKYLDRLAGTITATLGRELDKTFGTKFFSRMSGALNGALAGYAQAGPVGALLGATKASKGITDSLDKLFGAKGADGKPIFGSGADKLIGGAQQGGVVGKLATDLFGMKGSTTGGQIGGAIGAALPIPGGDIIGAVIGSMIGGALKKTKTGSATITNVTGDASLSGSSNKFKAAADDLAGSVQDIVSKIADQLGGQLGDFNVSIGIRDGKYRVDPTGSGITKTKKGAIDFGKDGAEQAIFAAAMDAIADGGVTGLSAAVDKALRSSKDIEKALQEAFKVKEVEDLLGGLTTEIDKALNAFENQARERVRIANQYGFDVLKIEEINAKERADLVDSILKSRVGALQDLLDDINFGGLFEGSASDQRRLLKEQIATAQADAQAGKEGAADRLAQLQRQLLQLSRDAFGTAGGEYAEDRAGAVNSAQLIIDAENARIQAAADAAKATNEKLDKGNQLTNETNDLLAEANALLRTIAAGGGNINAVVNNFRDITARQVVL
jgi:uncharacterized protein YoxC